MAKQARSRLSAKGQVTLPKVVRDAIGARPGDTILYSVRGKEVSLRRAEPFDAAFHSALSKTLDEWDTPEDDEAFGDL
jgi:antitoxin PrlF